MPAEIGDVAPDFTMPSPEHGDITLSSYRGEKTVVLSFHVFDFTAGWTTAAMSFRQANSRFEEKNAQVLGISCDSVHSHKAWSTAMGGLNYPELSDFHPKGKTTEAYGLWNDERGSGIRCVLVVDKEGIIRYRKTYTPGVLPDTDEILGVVDSIS